jgi:hypothetical protein
MTIHWKALEEHFLMVPLVLRLSKPTDMTIHWKALEEHFLMVPLVLRLSKPTDMTIHWKALEEHFLMVPLVLRFKHFQSSNRRSRRQMIRYSKDRNSMSELK